MDRLAEEIPGCYGNPSTKSMTSSGAESVGDWDSGCEKEKLSFILYLHSTLLEHFCDQMCGFLPTATNSPTPARCPTTEFWQRLPGVSTEPTDLGLSPTRLPPTFHANPRYWVTRLPTALFDSTTMRWFHDTIFRLNNLLQQNVELKETLTYIYWSIIH